MGFASANLLCRGQEKRTMRERKVWIECSSAKINEPRRQEGKTKMRPLTWLLLPLLAAAPVLAKPKVDVRIKVNDQIANRHIRSDQRLSARGPWAVTTPTLLSDNVYFANVTVHSANAEAVAKNELQWCITGDFPLDRATEYHGTLRGDNLEIEFPQKNGKINKEHFEIFDHKWRNLTDLSH